MNNYDHQALSFLNETKTTLIIEKAKEQKEPIWALELGKYNHGIQYICTLKNNKHVYTFDFWDSTYNKENNIRPTEYDILSSISPLFEDNFEDFCASFGYSNDSIRAKKIFDLSLEQDHNLRKLFNHDQIEKLTEIQ